MLQIYLKYLVVVANLKVLYQKDYLKIIQKQIILIVHLVDVAI